MNRTPAKATQAKKTQAKKTPAKKTPAKKTQAKKTQAKKSRAKNKTADETSNQDDVERRPAGVDDATVAATGKLSEALEWIERARGSLYEFHQKSGHADLLLGEAADDLEAAGHAELANQLREELVGRNVIEGRWTFQIVEDYDDTYWGAVRGFDQVVRDQLLEGARHVYESEMKERRRTNGRRHHEARPTD